jgi:predicted ATP-dependent endonuclease of OLD family
MLSSLKIENFRCFPTFELPQLGQLNLLVGTNNCGKTSILEAVQLLASSTLNPLREIMIDRGEYIVDEEIDENPLLDLSHLFHGREIDINSKFSIVGEIEPRKGDNSNDREQMSLFVSIEKILKEDLQKYNISTKTLRWQLVTQ